MSFYHKQIFLFLCLSVFGYGKGLWASTAASYNDVIRQGFLVGNGRLGGMPFTALPGFEKVNLNVDSLWSGGPFQQQNYSGGNPSSSVSDDLPAIREWIFQNGTGSRWRREQSDRFLG